MMEWLKVKSKLLLALKCFLNPSSNSRNLCSNCPFGYSIAIDDGSKEPAYTCDDLKILNDVYQYLEANTQHLLTKEEVRERGLASEPLWFEALDGSNVHNGWKLIQIYPPYLNEVYLCDFNQRGVFYNLKLYGKTWRAWAQPLVKEDVCGTELS